MATITLNYDAHNATKYMETAVIKREKTILLTENRKKSRVQLFMEEMQKNPMVKIIDMKAVLQ